jgi:hypothetical protein
MQQPSSCKSLLLSILYRDGQGSINLPLTTDTTTMKSSNWNLCTMIARTYNLAAANRVLIVATMTIAAVTCGPLFCAAKAGSNGGAGVAILSSRYCPSKRWCNSVAGNSVFRNSSCLCFYIIFRVSTSSGESLQNKGRILSGVSRMPVKRMEGSCPAMLLGCFALLSKRCMNFKKGRVLLPISVTKCM